MADPLTEQLREIAAAMGDEAPEAPLEIPSIPLASTNSTPRVSVGLGVRVAIGAALAVLVVVGGIQLVRPETSSVGLPPISVPPLFTPEGPWIQLDSPPQTSVSVGTKGAGWCVAASIRGSETAACTEPGTWKLPGVLDWTASWGSEPDGEVFGLASPEVASVLFEFADGATASVDTFGHDAQLGVAAYVYLYDTTESGLVARASAIAGDGQALGTYDFRTDLCSSEFERMTGQLVDRLCADEPDRTTPTQPSVPATTVGASTAPPAVASVSEVETENVPYLAENAPYPAGSITREQHVAQELAVTGLEYDPRPRFAHDAVVANGRAVFVGGDASIWYSDDGTWKPAVINLPSGMTIGESNGDYRLGDGIQNIATDGTRMVAWEYIQIVQGTEPVGAGTLILTSRDGSTWTATLTAEAVSAAVPWGDGYIGSLSQPLPDSSGGSQSSLGWSTDLITWTQLHDLGAGSAMALETDPKGLVVWFEDGSLPEPPEDERNPDHPEDAPLRPYLRAYLVETQPTLNHADQPPARTLSDASFRADPALGGHVPGRGV